MQNANPTILSLSDLPTRKPAPSTHPHSHLASIPPNYSTDPFSPLTPSLSDLSDSDSEDDSIVETIDPQEIYDLVATMCDPEHPITLGQLAVVNLEHISVHEDPNGLTSTVSLEFTPTITHCHLATVIGLGLVVRLQQALPPRFRIDVKCREGTHTTDKQLNKQLADKERVMSALENDTLMGLVGKMIETC
ncbi:hypothetical protein K440DRAFT_612238, partial [Wilcoxina mikolae CBS 423.85]